MKDYDERLAAIEELASRFPSAELTEQNIKGYVWSLGDLNLPVLRAAIDKSINTAKFFPTVAEIRENVEAVASAGSNENRHPDTCACFGTGMIIPERVNGYSPGARRCDGPVSDPDDVSMF